MQSEISPPVTRWWSVAASAPIIKGVEKDRLLPRELGGGPWWTVAANAADGLCAPARPIGTLEASDVIVN